MPPKVNIDEYNDVWIFIEQIERQPARVSLELLHKGRELADKLDVSLVAFAIGESLGNLAEELIYYGADRVIIADDPVAKNYRTEVYTDIIVRQATEEKPQIIIIGATPVGRDLAPRVARRLNTGCTADCTGLDIDEDTKLLISTVPAFGGNIMATIICPDHRPQIATVRPGVMLMPGKDVTRKGEITNIKVKIKEEEVKVKIIESIKSKGSGVKLEEAEKIVVAGMGAGDQDTIKCLKELAMLIGGELGVTMPVVEAGFLSHDHIIGQTGKTIRPKLYIGCGVSGAVQHTAGMSESELIVAINNDPNADIFKMADYGIIGNAGEIIPAIIKRIKKENATP